MPDHCFATIGKAIKENNIDFEVAFNKNPLSIPKLKVSSIDEFNSYLCGSDWITDSTRLNKNLGLFVY